MSDSQLDELDIFAYKWCQYGTEELGWTDNLCKAILCSPNRVLNKKGDLAMVHTLKKLIPSMENSELFTTMT